MIDPHLIINLAIPMVFIGVAIAILVFAWVSSREGGTIGLFVLAVALLCILSMAVALLGTVQV